MISKKIYITNINKLLLKALWLQFLDKGLELVRNHIHPIDWGLYNMMVDIRASSDHKTLYDHVDPDQLNLIRILCVLHLITYNPDNDIIHATPLGMSFIEKSLAPKAKLKSIRYISCINPLDPASFNLSRSIRNIRKCSHLTCSIIKYLSPKLTHVDMITMYKLLQKFYISRISINDEVDNWLTYPTLNSFCSYIEQTSFDRALPIGVKSRINLLKSSVHNVVMEHGSVLDNPMGFIAYYSKDPKDIHIYKTYFAHYYKQYSFNSINNITTLDLMSFIIKHYDSIEKHLSISITDFAYFKLSLKPLLKSDSYLSFF